MDAFAIIIIVFVVAVIGLALVAPIRRRRTRPGIEPGPPAATKAPPRPRPTEAPRPSTRVLTPEDAAAEAEAVFEAEAEAEAVEVPPAPPPVKPRFRDRLGKARGLLAGYVGSVLSRSTIDDETWDELEEALVRADVGVAATTALLDDLRSRVKAERITSPQELVDALKDDLKKSLAPADRGLRYEPGAPNVWLFVGVNGVGKTTTIGKVAHQQQAEGRTTILAAGDTFRAAAAEQLDLWAHRVGAPLVRGAEGGDPGAVVFDAIERAAAKNIDIVLADTAGRLHTKTNLMEELGKIRRVAERPPGRVTEVLLVIDATTGQNGLVQAREFAEAVAVTGIVLTKLDGTAKGASPSPSRPSSTFPSSSSAWGRRSKTSSSSTPRSSSKPCSNRRELLARPRPSKLV